MNQGGTTSFRPYFGRELFLLETSVTFPIGGKYNEKNAHPTHPEPRLSSLRLR